MNLDIGSVADLRLDLSAANGGVTVAGVISGSTGDIAVRSNGTSISLGNPDITVTANHNGSGGSGSSSSSSSSSSGSNNSSGGEDSSGGNSGGGSLNWLFLSLLGLPLLARRRTHA